MAKKVNIEITNPVGLYASPATELVDALKLYKSHVTLNYGDKSVNIIHKSMYLYFCLMGVLSLGIPHKAQIGIVVDGEDEEAVVEILTEKMKSLEIGTIQ